MLVLIAVDGSEVSLEAVRFAIRLARSGLQIRVLLANVQEAASLYELLVAHDPQVIEQVSAAAGAHTLEAAQGLLEQAGIRFEAEVVSGDPAHALVEMLERHACDLIVLGASGTSTLRSALLGSVSNEVLHAAAVPVVIVKAAALPDGGASEDGLE